MLKRLALSRWQWLLLALALSTPFWSLSHPLIEVDDARYAEVPREMAAGGDWATPHLDGFAYVEKPPLWYWACAASYKVFGVSEAAARLAMAVFAVAGLAGTLWLGAWLFSPAVGALACALLSCAGLYFFLEHYLTPDLPLTVCLLFSTGFALRALERPEDAGWAGPLAWAAAGLAFLAKGLIGIVFPAGWVFWLAVFFPRWRKPAWKLIRPLGLLLFFAIAAPWFLLMERRHPGFLRFMFVEQHIQRFLTHKYNRGNPWWFFFVLLPVCVLPWMPAFLDGFWRAARRWRSQPLPAALAVWIAMITIFFSKSDSKLITYILPVLPQCALLAALAWQEPARWARRLALGLGGLLLAAAAAAPLAAKLALARLPAPPVPLGANLAVACAALAALGLGLLWYGLERPRRWVPLAAGWVVGALSLCALRLDAGALSAKALGAVVDRVARPGDQLWVYDTYVHGLPFYAGRPVDKVVEWIGELHYAKRDPANAARFGDDDTMKALPLKGQGVVVVLKTRDARHLFTVVDAQKADDLRSVGPWTVLRF